MDLSTPLVLAIVAGSILLAIVVAVVKKVRRPADSRPWLTTPPNVTGSTALPIHR